MNKKSNFRNSVQWVSSQVGYTSPPVGNTIPPGFLPEKPESLEQLELPLDNHKYYPYNNIPHKCPVCYGKGIVPNGFYDIAETCYTTTLSTSENCKSCHGKGIIWG